MNILNFCEDCFKNIEIKSIIKSSSKKGNCDFNREHKNVSILNIEEDEISKQVKDILTQIIEIYSPYEELPLDFPKGKLEMLHNSLKIKWSIFNLDNEEIFSLLQQFYKEDNTIDNRLFEGLVGVKEETNLDDNMLIVKQNDWDKFVNSIKFQNRYHTKTINLNVLKEFLKYTEHIIEPDGLKWFRCRISNDIELEKQDMLAPPKEKATAGRLNAQWISNLYLGDKKSCCIQEIRASFHDQIYIAEFELIKSIKVADLRYFEDKTMNPEGNNLLQYYLNRNTLHKISNELSKPSNNNEKGLHYLPLQYISDYIKSLSIGFDGILYKSVMDDNASNLVLFDENLAKCIFLQKNKSNKLIISIKIIL